MFVGCSNIRRKLCGAGNVFLSESYPPIWIGDDKYEWDAYSASGCGHNITSRVSLVKLPHCAFRAFTHSSGGSDVSGSMLAVPPPMNFKCPSRWYFSLFFGNHKTISQASLVFVWIILSDWPCKIMRMLLSVHHLNNHCPHYLEIHELLLFYCVVCCLHRLLLFERNYDHGPPFFFWLFHLNVLCNLSMKLAVCSTFPLTFRHVQHLWLKTSRLDLFEVVLLLSQTYSCMFVEIMIN